MLMHRIMARKGGYIYIGLNSMGRPTCVVDCTSYHGIDDQGLAQAEKLVYILGDAPMSRTLLETALVTYEDQPQVVAVLRQYL